MSLEKALDRYFEKLYQADLVTRLRSNIIELAGAIEPLDEARFWMLRAKLPWPAPRHPDERKRVCWPLLSDLSLVDALAMLQRYNALVAGLRERARPLATHQVGAGIKAFIDGGGHCEGGLLYSRPPPGPSSLLEIKPELRAGLATMLARVAADAVLVRGADELAATIADPSRIAPVLERYDPVRLWLHRDTYDSEGELFMVEHTTTYVVLRELASNGFDDQAVLEVARMYGKPVPYRARMDVRIDELVEHPKFGLGIVANPEKPTMARFMFADGPKVLLASVQ